MDDARGSIHPSRSYVHIYFGGYSLLLIFTLCEERSSGSGSSSSSSSSGGSGGWEGNGGRKKAGCRAAVGRITGRRGGSHAARASFPRGSQDRPASLFFHGTSIAFSSPLLR